MVNSDNEVQVIKNGGKRSRPNSPITLTAPNGQGSESSEDEREGGRKINKLNKNLNILLVGRIRVGRDYQAVPPPFIPKTERRPEQCAERALLVWSPSQNIQNTKRESDLVYCPSRTQVNFYFKLTSLYKWPRRSTATTLSRP